MSARRVAFYAPMKAPDHPVPSGDRTIARHVTAALTRAGFEVELASRRRILDKEGDADAQARLVAAAEAEAAYLVQVRAWGAEAWVTYHCHYRSPDLLGPAVATALAIPYVIIEPSISPRRREGPWAGFAARSEAAIASADRLFWTTERDRPALEAEGHGSRMVHLPPFLDPGPEPEVRPPVEGRPLSLVTVAMMRAGDKFESYRRLARALRRLVEGPLAGNWTLTIVGDGPLSEEVTALFAPFDTRLPGGVTFAGAAEPAGVRKALEAADLMLWPGVGEGIGYAWLEAAAAGLPVVAEDGPAARDVVTGILAPPGDAGAFARAVEQAAADRDCLGTEARARVLARHSLDAAATTLGSMLTFLMERT